MIKISNVSKKFGEKEVLDNINLTINEGEITFIVGTSGAGKTTLLNIIGGLDIPTSGEVTYNGKDINLDLDEYRAKNIGFIFQDYNLVSGLNVLENIEIATGISGIRADKDDIISEIEALGISNPYQKVETLSGGEKQRAAIIRSICKDADILIADEPTGSLDSKNAHLVFEMIRSIKKEKHIIIVSHDMEKARKYADRIVTISDGNIEKDEMIPENSKETSLEEDRKKRKEKTKKDIFKSIFTLGRNSVRMRIGKIISVAVVIAFSIAALSTVININNMGKSLSHNVNVNYLENDLIRLFYGLVPNCGFMEYPFTDKEISEIENRYDLKDIVKIYVPDKHDLFFEAENKTINACMKQININDFFEERVMSNDIDGEFIKNDKEIILADDVANQLFGEKDCLGKKVFLNDGKGNKAEFSIVGINRTKNPSDEIYSFISADSMKGICEKRYLKGLYERQEVMNYYENVQTMRADGIYGPMKEVDDDLNIVYGSLPQSSNGILVSTELVSNMLYEFDININKYSKDEIISGKISSEDLKKIFDKKLVIDLNGVFQVNVTGIYLSDDVEIRYTDELIAEMKKIDPVSLEIYVSEPQRIDDIRDSINKNYDFETEVELDTLKQNVNGQTRFFSAALILIVIVLVCISFALLNSFSKIAVLERKKEIAIIKSLGANNGNVLCILLFDALIISFAAYIISIVISVVIKFVLPLFLKNINGIEIGFPFGVITLVSAVFTLLVLIKTSISLRKIVKQMPAELLIQ